MINKLTEEGKTRKAKKLQKIYDNAKVSKPNIDIIEPELDSRFVELDLNNKTSFDVWITLASLGYKFKIVIPFKKSKHFNKLLEKGKLKLGVRLSKSNLTFSFDIPKKEKKESGNILGIDIGQTTLFSCSDNQVSKKDKHGHDLVSISNKLSRKKKGSKAFKKAQDHRTNYTNWSVKQLNLQNVKQIRIENIKNLRLGKKSSRQLSRWVYRGIFDKLISHCKDFGVQVITVDPTYTSQRCSSCGWTRKSNRKGKLFKCGKCGNILDSDLNASKNIALPDLPTLGESIRLEHPNRKGFFWNCSGQEPIVPVVQRAT
jgi:IS605 OrfB family transposase